MAQKPSHNDRIRVKLIFNPASGSDKESPVQLLDILRTLQIWKIDPETFIITSDCDLKKEIQYSLSGGTELFVICGGDGTVSAAAKILAGTDGILGIIPTGTQNNIAKSLGVPTDINKAASVLRAGTVEKADIGIAVCGGKKNYFTEVCSVGLFSALFPAGNEIQHGNLGRVGDFISTLASTPSSEIRMVLDNELVIEHTGHIVMISNMPFAGKHYQMGTPDSFCDGLLDVVFSADLSKLDLMGYALKGNEADTLYDPRICRHQVQSIKIQTRPPMPIMADDNPIGEGEATISIWQRALNVLVASKDTKTLVESEESSDEEKKAAAQRNPVAGTKHPASVR